MEPADRAVLMSRTMSEALNSLGVFLCEPTLRQMHIDTKQELQRWEQEYAGFLRQWGPQIHPAGRARFVLGLDALSAAIRQDATIDVQEQLAAVRIAARDVLVGLGFPLPNLTPEQSAICSLHGAACPAASAK